MMLGLSSWAVTIRWTYGFWRGRIFSTIYIEDYYDIGGSPLWRESCSDDRYPVPSRLISHATSVQPSFRTFHQIQQHDWRVTPYTYKYN